MICDKGDIKMFTRKEKELIAQTIEDVLLNLDHPEMPKENPNFKIDIAGKEAWSWAEILPNWTYSEKNPPGENKWNNVARECMSNAKNICPDCGLEIYNEFGHMLLCPKRRH